MHNRDDESLDKGQQAILQQAAKFIFLFSLIFG